MPLGLHRSDYERPQQVRVSKLIDDVLSLYGRKLRTLGAAIDTRYDCDVPVTAFPGELQQVFSNLIVNAADALEKSGDKLCIHILVSLNWTNLTQKGVSTPLRIMGVESTQPDTCATIRFRCVVKQGRSGTTFRVFLPVL